MELDKSRADRSYQYGRLLAVLEKVERDTYDKDESREPNAIRLQTMFRRRPCIRSASSTISWSGRISRA